MQKWQRVVEQGEIYLLTVAWPPFPKVAKGQRSQSLKSNKDYTDCITLGLLLTRQSCSRFILLVGWLFVRHHSPMVSHHVQNTNCLAMGTSLISYS